MIEGKGLGGKRVNRLKLSLTNSDESDLAKLATACNMKKSELGYHMFQYLIHNPEFLNYIQKEYCTQKAYKVVLVNKNGNKQLALTGREDL
jgi:hypothetical protein